MTPITRTARRLLIVMVAGGAVASPAALAIASPAAAAGWQGDVKDYSTTYQLKGLEMKDHITLTCPDDHAFLINEDKAPGRIVPLGVSVQVPDGGRSVAVMGNKLGGWFSGYLMTVGINRMSMTNPYTADKTVIVTLSCSNNRADGYDGHNPPL